jgi:hypothetical protein
LTQLLKEDETDKSKAAVVDQLVRVQAELGRLAKLATIESAEREELVAMIQQLQAWVKSEVKLDLASLGQAFSGDKEAYLDAECNLVVIEEGGGVAKKALDLLDPALFLIVAREVAPRLLKMVSEKATGIMEQPKPSIHVIVLAGKKGSDFKKHRPHFFVMNSGGAAQDLGLSVRPRYSIGTYGRPKVFGPLKLDPNQQTELALDKFEEADFFTSLLIEVACKGPDGQTYRGRATFAVNNHDWQKITLSTS